MLLGSAVNISELKPFEGCEVMLHLKDGEVLRVKINFVDFEYQDIIVDVLDESARALQRSEFRLHGSCVRNNFRENFKLNDFPIADSIG